MSTTTTQTIDQYIMEFPADIQAMLQDIRQHIHVLVPDATEKISWSMPTFYLNGNLIHFAACKHHIGIYPGAKAVAHFQEKLKDYKTSKGAIQFPTTKPIPFDLLSEIVLFCVQESESNSKAK